MNKWAVTTKGISLPFFCVLVFNKIAYQLHPFKKRVRPYASWLY
jgi:hypothetical protein